MDIKLIRPLIIYIIKALNSIYGIYNLRLRRDEIEFLKELKEKYYEDKNENNVEDNKEEDNKDEGDDLNEEDEEEEDDEKYDNDYNDDL